MLITKFLIVQAQKLHFQLYSNSIFKEKPKHFKEKHTTLLLFRSGSVILSGIHENVMKKTFESFQKVTSDYKSYLT